MAEWYSESVVVGLLPSGYVPLSEFMKLRFSNLTSSTVGETGSVAVRTGRWFVLLLLCAVFCFATRGTGLSSQKVEAFAHGAAAATHFAIADFDGDSRPDLATVETGLVGVSHARYWIGFRLSAGARQMIGVNAPVGGLEIASRDVNGDNIVDLVVSTAWLKSPVVVLVNDGHGNFTIREPSAFSSALTNPSRTLESPAQQNPDTAIAVPARGSSDFIASERAVASVDSSEKLLTSNSLRKVFLLVVCSSGRAPPLSENHV
jgi:hypothetical protein